mgnify:CR=1 FL=1
MNPFEIRLQVLEMAKDFLDRQFEAANALVAMQKDAAEKLGDFKNWSQPATYSTEDLMKKAEEFYSFVAPTKNK